MAQFQVTASQLTQQADNLKQLNESLKSQIGILENTEATLVGQWEGDAKTAFHNAFMKDKGQMENFKNAIDQYIVALGNIASKYAQAESVNVETATTRTY